MTQEPSKSTETTEEQFIGDMVELAEYLTQRDAEYLVRRDNLLRSFDTLYRLTNEQARVLR